ncbi:dedicator of cytokinesis protein 1 [Lepeophtheirus salmonis]|uniref:dedicator of cytokinesis protein 1 n=1 Tax=Lepeophtheirus salmonis TaxID=72036 RepID=UPI001AE6E00F|nr:dedicator of cytokinesis protein 1-like [Lepeophtheirus salmonis]
MRMPWTRENGIGVALWSYIPKEGENKLVLRIGDVVEVLGRQEKWLVGRLCSNRGFIGAFPASFVALDPPALREADSVVCEAAWVLREWISLYRKDYVTRSKTNPIYDMMRLIVSLRSTLLSGKLPAEEAKEIRRNLTEKIDFMNSQRGLDLTIRHCDGKRIEEKSLSAVALFRQHHQTQRWVRSFAAVKGDDKDLSGPHPVLPETFQILLSIRSFSSGLKVDEADLITSIYEVYEGKSPKPLSESFLYSWHQRTSKTQRNKVLFADISKSDIANKRLYLITNVVTEGNYGNDNAKEGSRADLSRIKKEICFRKALGVAAIDITEQFTFRQGGTGKRHEGGREAELSIPFISSGSESESLENTFKRLINTDRKSQESNLRRLGVKLNIVFGGDLHNSNSHHLDLTGSVTSLKIGLPDVILPSDVRNDLYITLSYGEFSRLDKRQDRNVEVMVELCDNSMGDDVEGGISPGVLGTSSLCPPRRCYSSVVYRHEAKPRWNEIIKISVPVDKFANSHLRFLFRHRSRSETKEKSVPWAFAFLKLVNDVDGTALKNGRHELLVYKIDKKFEGHNTAYLSELPHLKCNHYRFKLKNSNNLGVLSKDIFVIKSVLCSTKLTQNDGLLSLLKWRSEPKKLYENLQIFKKKVNDNGHEVVKFLPDVLDALFSILMENRDSESNDQKVFKILIFVIQIVTDTKYQLFIPVLEVYIQENFSATLAYSKLLTVLKDCVEMGSVNARDLTEAMKSLKYLFKFIVRSRTLFSDLNGGRGKEAFEDYLKQVLTVIVELMFSTSDELTNAQEDCLRHMIQSIPDLVTVLDRRELAAILVKMIRAVQFPEQNMKAINDLIHSDLFMDMECRSSILAAVVEKIKEVFDDDEEKGSGKAPLSFTPLMSLCIKTLGDVLNLLCDTEKYTTTYEDIDIIMKELLRPVIRAVARRRREGEEGLIDDNTAPCVAVLLSMFEQLTPTHYSKYVEGFNPNNFGGRTDLSDFVSEALNVFKNLIIGNGFKKHWISMNLLMNYIILKALRNLSHTIYDYFHQNFDHNVWSHFFEASMALVVHPSLQLEIFSEEKRSRILSSYGDIRKDMAKEVKSMWFNLGNHKIQFIPHMVGPFLKMSLIPESELRKSVIPIFFDMMQCEFYSVVRGREHKGNFFDFEREMIEKLDVIIEHSGDEYFKILFRDLMTQLFDSHSVMKDPGLKFVRLVTKQLELLLEYRSVVTPDDDHEKSNRMSCIVNLLDFYKSVKRDEMYVRYLKKIIVLHEKCENYSEAAFTLLQYTKLLSWTDKPLSPVLLYKERHPEISTNWTLKELLHKDIISNFEKSHMWEWAIKICEVLELQYKEETFDYPKLAELHDTMAGFYNNIMTDLRPEPEYFRVAFYGRGFAAFLQNKTFVYRGRGYEKLSEFQNRIMDQFPDAELMKTLETPSDEESQKPIQLVQINKVEPVMEEKRKFQGKKIRQQILDYYRVNEVNKFMYSRPYMKDKQKDNEFASLWVDRTVMYTKEMFPGVLQWFQVLIPTETFTLCPLDNAIENMYKTNEDLRRLILGDPPFNLLSMKVKGVIDAAVNGGISKYEKAFFSESYIQEHPDHEDKIRLLKNLIAEQIPDLDILLQLHDHKKRPELNEFHESLVKMFETIRNEVEERYGKRRSEFSLIVSSNCVVRHNGNTQEGTRESTRYSMASQSSFDAGTKSRSSVFSVINGLSRKKSIVSHHNHRNDSITAVDATSPSVVVTQQTHTRIVSGTQYLIHQHALTTPNHSRSPSISSNRDSFNDVFEDDVGSLSGGSNRHSNGCGHDSSGDAMSVSSFDETRPLFLKKKAPAPPPPSFTPPTPPSKKPPKPACTE